MSVITGYIGGPSGTGVPVQATAVSGTPVSVVLNARYYPADLGGVLGARPSFDGSPVPSVVNAGTALTLPKAEAAALLAAGYATGA